MFIITAKRFDELISKVREEAQKSVSLSEFDTFLEWQGLPDVTDIKGSYFESIDAYRRNAVLYAGVDSIAAALKGVPVMVFRRLPDGDSERAEGGPLSWRLRRPNPTMSWQSFIEWAASSVMLDGNTYIRRVPEGRGGDPDLRWDPLRPDRVEAELDARGNIKFWKYKYGSSPTKIEKIKTEDLLHIRNFDSRWGISGQSYAEAALRGVKAHDLATIHGIKTLENDGRPSGIISCKFRLAKDQKEQLEEEIKRKLGGAKKSGSVLLSHGGDIEFIQLSKTQKDLDWLEGKKMAVFEICGAIGIDPIIVGFPEFSTYNNKAEAKRSLYHDRALPMLDHILEELSYWIAPRYGEDLYINYRESDIRSLKEDRGEKWKRTLEALKEGALTVNEWREENSLSPRPEAEADQLWAPMDRQPIDALGLAPEDEE